MRRLYTTMIFSNDYVVGFIQVTAKNKEEAIKNSYNYFHSQVDYTYENLSIVTEPIHFMKRHSDRRRHTWYI